MVFDRFERYVNRHAHSFSERLQALCRIPSVAARGTGMRQTAEMVGQLLQRIGAGTRNFKTGSGFPLVYGEAGSGDRSYLVYSHYDVAPVGHVTRWSYGPFASTVVDGKLYARGAANSKGDLVARIAAVESYQKTFGKLPLCLKFIVDGESGLGSPSLERFASENAAVLGAEGSIWNEGYKDTSERLVLSLGFKGIVFVELRAKGARTDLHSRWGAIVPNPAWRLVQALSTITSPNSVITIDRFTSHIAPVSRADAEILKTIDLDEEGLKKEFQISGWLRGMKGSALVKEHIFGASCNVCGIQTGHTDAGPKTVLPSSAIARLDFRLVPDLTPELVLSLLREHLDARGFADIEVAELGSVPVAKSAGSSRVARAAIEAAAEVYAKPPIVYPMHPSSSPAGLFRSVDGTPLPLMSFGTSYSGSNPHGPDENIRLDDFVESIKFFGRVIHKLGQSHAGEVGNAETRELIQPA